MLYIWSTLFNKGFALCMNYSLRKYFAVCKEIFALFMDYPFMKDFALCIDYTLTLLHSERPKLYAILVFLSAVGLRKDFTMCMDYTLWTTF